MHNSSRLQRTLKSCSHLQVPAWDVQNACNSCNETMWKPSDKIFCVAERGSCFKQKTKSRGHLSGKSRWCGSRKAWALEKGKMKMVPNVLASPPELRGWAILFNTCMRQGRAVPDHGNALWKQRGQAEHVQVGRLHVLLVSPLSKHLCSD